MDKLQRRLEIASAMDKTIDALAKNYRDLTMINSQISGNRNFDTVETARRVVACITAALANPATQQGPFGTARDRHLRTLAESCLQDHEEHAKKGRS